LRLLPRRGRGGRWRALQEGREWRRGADPEAGESIREQVRAEAMAVVASQIASINPVTEEVLRTFDAHRREQVEDAIAAAQDAFVAWRARSFAERAVPMKRLAALLRERSDRYARLMTLEMGKPITEAKAEIEKCALGCDFFAENAERFLAPEIVKTTAQKSYVAYEPLGIVLAVMPWNFPFWQVIRFAAPPLMAGNAAVLKHASNVPQCGLAIEEAFRDAGFPDGLLRTLLLACSQVQPATADERQVDESLRMGARLLTGGKRWGDRGGFYTPTVLADVTPDMPVFAEETFGPVAAIIRARDADEAIELANRTEYGLGANLWTRDTATAERLARRIESGQVFINGMVASDPRLPFGGVKHSGFGRELSAFGIREFVNIQTVWIGPAQTAQAT